MRNSRKRNKQYQPWWLLLFFLPSNDLPSIHLAFESNTTTTINNNFYNTEQTPTESNNVK